MKRGEDVIRVETLLKIYSTNKDSCHVLCTSGKLGIKVIFRAGVVLYQLVIFYLIDFFSLATQVDLIQTSTTQK